MNLAAVRIEEYFPTADVGAGILGDRLAFFSRRLRNSALFADMHKFSFGRINFHVRIDFRTDSDRVDSAGRDFDVIVQ